jgi:hypothetical protein
MSTRIGKALADLEHDTSLLRMAPPAQVRARGETWRRHRVTGGVAAAVAGTVAATIFGVAAVGRGSATSPMPVRVSPAASSSAAVAEADCGRHVLEQSEVLPDVVIACFLDAVAARRPVRLAETRPTVEGDPIHVLYVADATGAVQVTTDSRQDSHSSRLVTRQTCTGPVADYGHIGFAQCSSPGPA